MRRSRERQKKRARERWGGKEGGEREGGRKKKGERTPLFIVLEYGNLQSQVCHFLYSTFPEGYEKPITANLN